LLQTINLIPSFEVDTGLPNINLSGGLAPERLTTLSFQVGYDLKDTVSIKPDYLFLRTFTMAEEQNEFNF